MKGLELLILVLVYYSGCKVTASSSKCAGTNEIFSCATDGRHDDPNDPTCTMYYLCASSITIHLNCPSGSYYNPSTALCSKNYDCICNANSTQSTTTLLTSMMTTTTEVTSIVTTTNAGTVSHESSNKTCLINNTSAFTCTETGRYQNTSDPYCTYYIYCYKSSSGKLILADYSCPAKSYFNPETQLCDENYVCSCSNESETTTTQATTSTSSTTIQSSTESSVACIAETKEFNCTENGRFKNPADPYCTSYIYCYKLLSVIFVKSEYTCSEGSYFNSSSQSCESDYICPCTNSSDTTLVSTSTATTSATTSETYSTITATTEISESINCTVDTDTVFNCTETGRYKNPKDPYCRSYIYCYKASSGNIIKAEYSCPTMTYFNSAKQLCDEDYVCTCSISTETTTKATTTTSTVQTTTQSSENCVADNTTFTCTENGRFKNPADPYCTSYIYCYKLSSARFIKSEYTCSDGSYFNSDSQACESDYKCPCSISTELTTQALTTTISTSTSTTDLSASDNCSIDTTTEVNCTETGRYKNPTDPYCTSYIYCFKSSSGNIIKAQYSCPDKTYFNSVKQLCDENYVCPCSTNVRDTTTLSSTTTESTTQSSENCIANSTTFTCTETGNFKNPADPYCTSYIYCYKLRSLIFVKSEYTCSVGSYFNSSSQSCESDYMCPCTNSTDTTLVSTNTAITSATTSETYPTTAITTELSKSRNCTVDTDTVFNCTETGRYKNPKDPYCTSYIYCYKASSGNIIKAEYSCPTMTYFNSAKQLCDEDYVCPCSISTETTAKATTTTSTVQTTTQSSENCVADNTTFTCTENGRFKNPADPYCTSYIYCYKLTSARFIKSEYTCSDGSYFNSDSQACESDYKCPCSISTKLTTQALTTTMSTSTSTTDLSESDNCSIDTTTEVNCTETGRYKNPIDPYCTSYIYCLKSSSGNIIKTQYSCPDKTYFNSVKQLCDENYVCPCSTNVRDTTTLSSTTTESTTQSSENCIANSTTFTCTETGNFKNPADPYCTSYIYCYKLRSLIFVKSEYTCSVGSYFNSSSQSCESDYMCPCTNSTDTTLVSTNTAITSATTSETYPTTAITTELSKSRNCTVDTDTVFNCTETGRYKNPKDPYCTSYIYCYKGSSGNIIKAEYSCPTMTYFNSAKQLCDEDYVCPCSISTETTAKATTTTSTVQTTTQSSENCVADNTTFTCTENGRFKNPADPYCTSYIYCYKLTSARFIKSEYTCSDGSYFNSDSQACESDYKCPCSISTELTTQALTTTMSTSTSTTDLSESDNCSIDTTTEVNCTETGRYKNPNDPYCTSYIYCLKSSSGNIIKAQYSCPDETYFNSVKQLCDENYVCPCSTNVPDSTTRSSTTTESVTIAVTTEISKSRNCTVDTDTVFNCTETGRYKNPKDPYCTSYIYCYKASSGNIIKAEYSCPTKTYFNSAKQLCDEDYVCPCSTSTETTTEATTTTSTIQTTTQSSENCVADNTTFTCTENGRFKNAADPYCTSYIYCYKLSSARFIKSEYTCSDGSYFNSDSQACESDYKCPCSISTELTTQASTTTMSTSTSTTASSESNNCSIDTTTEFNCSETGRYKNPKDPYCTSYIYCYKSSTGNVIKAEYNCPIDTYFNSAKQLCDEDYVCPCNNNVTATTSQATTTATVTTNESTNQTLETCIADTTAFTCTENGRFKNPADPYCTSYIYCYKLSSGRYIKTEYKCSDDSYFNVDSQSCESEYTCPCRNSSQTTTQATTTLSTTTIQSTTEISDSCIADTTTFSCTESGRFKNPADPYCTSYVYCYKLNSGRFIKSDYTCSDTSYFNSNSQLCESDYICPCRNSTETTTQVLTTATAIVTDTPTTEITTESDHCIPKVNVEFNCTESGQFSNPRDPFCSSFIYCFRLSDVGFVKAEYNCPLNTYFSLSQQTCTDNYICPCKNSGITTIEPDINSQRTTSCNL